MSLNDGRWETLELSFSRSSIEKVAPTRRVVVHFSISMALDERSAEEQQVEHLKHHVSKILRTRPGDGKIQRSRDHGRHARRRNNIVHSDLRTADSTDKKQEPISQIVAAIVHGNEMLRSEESNKIGWRDDLETFKPVGPSPDGLDLCTRYKIYGDLASHRLHQTIVLRCFLALSECGRGAEPSKQLLLYGKFARLLASVMMKLPIKRDVAADHVCAALAGERLAARLSLASRY
jgi:hypothetical protein